MKTTYFLILLLLSISNLAQVSCDPFYPTMNASGYAFGADVTIYDNNIAVSSYSYQSLNWNGKVFVFDNSSGSVNQTANLYPADAQITDFFGRSISISNEYLACGSPSHDMGATDGGAVYIYHKNGTSWDFVQKLQSTDVMQLDNYGQKVKLFNDFLFVAAVGDDAIDTNTNDNNGSVYVYKRNGISWDFLQKITLSTTYLFGYDIQIDNNIVYILNTNPFTISSYTFNGSNWIYQNTSPTLGILDINLIPKPTLTVSNNLLYLNNANTVSIYDTNNNYNLDGTLNVTQGDFMNGTIKVLNDNMFIGFSTYILQLERKFPVNYYKKIENTWQLQTTMYGTGAFGSDDSFGGTIDAYGDTVLIGAPDEGTAISIGKAYTKTISTLSTSTFSNETITIYPNPSSGVLNISGIESSDLDKVTVSQIDGKLVKSITSNFDNLSIAELQESLYFVTIFRKNQLQSTYKIIKK